MNFYQYNIVAFVLLNTFLVYRQRRREGRARASSETNGKEDWEKTLAAEAVNWQFKKRFLPVYLLVFGADWLQVL